jgi:hypothetical protein
LVVVDERHEYDDEDVGALPSGYGWTSARATRMYYVLHAPFEELLDYLGLDPLPPTPPAA